MYTGMRAGELLATRWLDIDLKTQSVHINTLKKGKPREIPVPRKILNEVAKLRLGAMDDEKVFKIGYPRLVQIWNNYRPAKAKFHSLRHTFALSLYDKTKDIRLVMFSLGHRQVTTTMIYANYNYSIKELKKAMGVK
jgi:integrase/recombinase XerC